MTSTSYSLSCAIAERARIAQHKLAHLAQLAFGEGFLPDIAAAAAGYPNREAAVKAALHAKRPELADALRPPSTAQRRAAQIEDIEFLLSVGEEAERAAIRSGFTSAKIARQLLRDWGRDDVADRLVDTPPHNLADEFAA